MTMQLGQVKAEVEAEAGSAPGPIGPACPQNWYLVATSAELRAGAILTRPLGSIEIVLYRGRDSGRAVAFAAHCAHAGCHLRHGAVVGDNLRCGLHHRIIAPGGQFVAKDGSALAGARQLGLPVIERFGCIFVFAGAKAAFDLPTPDICTLGPVTTRALPPRTFPLPWSTLTSNGMDMDHLQAVHDRELIEPATLRHIDEHRVRLSYRARVTGSHLSDRMMKWLSNDEVRTSITCVAGSMMLVDSAVGRHRTFVILSMCPVGRGASSARAVAGVAGAPERASARLSVAVAAWLFGAFLEKDVGVLQQMNWREPDVEITPGDALMRGLCRFFRSLPEFDPAAEPPVARAAAPAPARAIRTGT
jgi:aminopyrrolnitrin oxygenase